MSDQQTPKQDGGQHEWGPHFYGRRKGKALRPGRVRLLEDFLPTIALPIPPQGETIDPKAVFAKPVDEVWLEIGFGGGEHLAGQAEANPNVGIIGIEVFINGVAKLLSLINQTPSEDNVRIHHGDARPVLPALPDQSLDKVLLLFPDPWPKTRYAKRRFIGPKNLAQVSRILKDGGEFRVASDDMTYVRWTLQHLMDHPDFEWTAEEPKDWLERPEGWVQTRYEAKALREGRVPHVLRFRRKNRT